MKKSDENSNQKLRASGAWEDDHLPSSEDEQLLERISNFFRAEKDIEEVMSDPLREEICDRAVSMVSEFAGRGSHNDEIRNFVQDNFLKDDNGKSLNEEIRQIKQEIKDSDVESISAAWVKEWHERKQKETDIKSREIRDFVTTSFQNESSSQIINNEPVKSQKNKTRIIRYTSIAAAAILAFVFLVRYFIPSGKPDSIFSRYYEPYYAASLVTRSSVSGGNENLDTALEIYKSGNYQLAAVEFSDALLEEPESDLPRFYLGVTFIELENYDRAVRLLEPIAGRPGEFNKDAKWYLGLVWLKSGDREKAIRSFEYLAGDPGFYKKRSEKILRLLKKQ